MASPTVATMFPDWNHLSDDLQISLSREALYRAAATIAAQAEVLAAEIENGNLEDRGGPEALRLFAAVVRSSDGDELAPQGMAEPITTWRGWDGSSVAGTPASPARAGSGR
jgi:hypothetical protein